MTFNYKDLDFNLEKTVSNDFTVLQEEDSVRQSIKNLLLTNLGFAAKFEKPELGSNINKLLSEKPTKFIALQIKDQIELTLENYEPRIVIEKITVEFDKVKSYFKAELFYKVISTDLNQTLTLNLNLIT